jgi:hypothetical protein
MSKKVLNERDFSWPTNAEIRRELEQELRTMSREQGSKRIATLEQEAREMEYATKLARGVNAQNSPQCAASQRSQRERIAKAKQATKSVVKERVEAKAKAAKAKREAVSNDATRITIVNKAYVFGRDGSARQACWQACLRSKTVGEYLSAGGAKKYLPRWEQAGAIRLG